LTVETSIPGDCTSPCRFGFVQEIGRSSRALSKLLSQLPLVPLAKSNSPSHHPSQLWLLRSRLDEFIFNLEYPLSGPPAFPSQIYKEEDSQVPSQVPMEGPNFFSISHTLLKMHVHEQSVEKIISSKLAIRPVMF